MMQSDGIRRSCLSAIGLALVFGMAANAGNPPPGTPKVQLSEAHAATCLVKVGGAFPDIDLADSKGAAVKLHGLRGGKPAIVAFWNGTHHARREMMDDLAAIANERGAKLVIAAVQVGAAPAKPIAAPAVQQVVDAKGTGYAAVAKGNAKMPRIYLLDAAGDIIWMDIEYAVDTRRQLSIALDALFPRPAAAAR